MNMCKATGCNRQHYALGYCEMHRMRLLRHGSADYVGSIRGGQTNHPLFSTYSGMKQRCSKSSGSNKANYYDKGITICERWLGPQGFFHFVEDMGDKCSPELTLDRIDNSQGYSPDNCRWATRLQQVYNRGTFKNNKSGLTGVSWDKVSGRWKAQARIRGHKTALGLYNDIHEAHDAYLNSLMEIEVKDK